jgi:glyoxylase-like metal-dependent hydrolase (beta-lactamase superfamily II)
VVNPRIRRVLAPNPSPMTGEGTNTYLVGDDDLAVIDPGPGQPRHLEAILAEAGSAAIRAIFVTHRHSDHLPAALPLAERSGAPLYGHPDLPGVERPLADEAVVQVGDFHVRALATPGHTPEHCCYVLEEADSIFCGDLMAGSGTVIVGSAEGELVAYLDSLRRLLDLAPARILPGHGPPIDDPAAKIREYLDHRQMREDQIMAALAARPSSIRELRAAIYADTPAALATAAENNIRTHLLKLRAEGRVAEMGGRWELRDVKPP